MISPSQEKQIKNFLDDLLFEHDRAKVRRNSISPECETVEWLMERAENLRVQLDIWTVIPEGEPEHELH